MIMENQKTQEQLDEEAWDDILNSNDGQLALEELLKNADKDIENGNLTKD